YQVVFNGETVIQPSELGLEFKNVKGFVRDLKIIDHQTASADSTWEQPWGERHFVRDHHNELLVTFAHADAKNAKAPSHMNIRVRVFNDGLGFRYEVPQQKKLADNRKGKIDIVDEKTTFNFSQADKITAWWTPSRGWNRYEYLYNTTPLDQAGRVHTPVTMKLPSGTHISIHEAALVDYAAMTLEQQRSGVLKADLTPWSD